MVSTTSDPGDFDFPAVNLPANADTYEAIVQFLLEELVRAQRVQLEHAESIKRQILHRESIGSTAVGRAVAIPHAKSTLVKTVVGIIGRCPTPVEWPGSIDNQPVGIVCLFVAPESHQGDAIRVFEFIAKKLWQNPDKN